MGADSQGCGVMAVLCPPARTACPSSPRECPMPCPWVGCSRARRLWIPGIARVPPGAVPAYLFPPRDNRYPLSPPPSPLLSTAGRLPQKRPLGRQDVLWSLCSCRCPNTAAALTPLQPPLCAEDAALGTLQSRGTQDELSGL